MMTVDDYYQHLVASGVVGTEQALRGIAQSLYDRANGVAAASPAPVAAAAPATDLAVLPPPAGRPQAARPATAPPADAAIRCGSPGEAVGRAFREVHDTNQESLVKRGLPFVGFSTHRYTAGAYTIRVRHTSRNVFEIEISHPTLVRQGQGLPKRVLSEKEVEHLLDDTLSKRTAESIGKVVMPANPMGLRRVGVGFDASGSLTVSDDRLRQKDDLPGADDDEYTDERSGVRLRFKDRDRD